MRTEEKGGETGRPALERRKSTASLDAQLKRTQQRKRTRWRRLALRVCRKGGVALFSFSAQLAVLLFKACGGLVCGV